MCIFRIEVQKSYRKDMKNIAEIAIFGGYENMYANNAVYRPPLIMRLDHQKRE